MANAQNLFSAFRSLAPPFNPEGTGYDILTAIAAGLKRNSSGHMGSLDPRTGQVLKGRKHPTFDLMLKEENRLGNLVFKAPDKRYYSFDPKPSLLDFLTPRRR